MAVGASELDGSAVRTARSVRVTVGRLRRKLREHHDRAELTASQTAVLGRLDRDGPASASELAAAEDVRAQSMAMTVAALVERGFARRDPDPADGRRQVVSATAAGRDLLANARSAGEGWLAVALQEHLTAAEQQTVREAMTLLDRVAGA